MAVAGRWRAEHGDEDYDLLYDVDGDGTITVIDIMQVAAAWGWSCSGGDASHAASAGRQAFLDSGQRATSDAPLVSLQPISSTVEAGETFTVSTVISNAAELGAFQYVLRYDPRVLHGDGAALGPFLGSTGRNTSPLGPTIDNEAGKVTFGAFSFGMQLGPDGEGVLAQLALTAKGAGTSTLDLQAVQVLDPAAELQPVTLSDGTAMVEAMLYLPLVLRIQ
jgi:hypothetical protein